MDAKVRVHASQGCRAERLELARGVSPRLRVSLSLPLPCERHASPTVDYRYQPHRAGVPLPCPGADCARPPRLPHGQPLRVFARALGMTNRTCLPWAWRRLLPPPRLRCTSSTARSRHHPLTRFRPGLPFGRARSGCGSACWLRLTPPPVLRPLRLVICGRSLISSVLVRFY